MNIYGKRALICRRNSQGDKYGLWDRTLEIYQTKKGLKGVLFNSGTIGWRKKKNIISIAHFYYKDGDATYQRVQEYFGF